MSDLIKMENNLPLLSPDACNKIASFEREIKMLKEAEDAIKSAILTEMELKGITKIETEEMTITYIAPTDRETFDGKSFRSSYPDLYDAYVRMSPVKSSMAGTRVHEAIELYCRTGVMADDVPEVRNFRFLKNTYHFDVIENEMPVILFDGDEPISAGRMDMVIMMGGTLGIADIKRTSALDKEYLFYQLNLYAIAYRQNHGVAVDFLRGIHLKDDIRKFVPIPINELMAWEIVQEWRKNNEIEQRTVD